MAAKNVGKMTVEWAALQSKLPAGSRTGLASVRSQFQALQKKLNEVPEEPAPIDFASYKAKIASPGFVDLVAADYKEAAAKITYPEDTKSAQIAADQAKATAAVDALIQESNAKLSSLKAAQAALESMKPIDEVTVDEFLADKPELKAEIASEIAAHKYD